MYIRDRLFETIGLKEEALEIFKDIEKLYLRHNKRYLGTEVINKTKNFIYRKAKTSGSSLLIAAKVCLERAILEEDLILKYRYYRLYAILKKLAKILYEVVQAYRSGDIDRIYELDKEADFYLKLLEQDKVYATIKQMLDETFIYNGYKLSRKAEEIEIAELGIKIVV